MLGTERNPYVLTSIAYALGHVWDPTAADALLDLSTHADDEVRLAAVQGLPGSVDHGDDPVDERIVRALIRLTEDPVAEIRNWATFGLRSTEATGPEVDRALLARLHDEGADTRAEACMTLALRRDERVIAPLIEALSRRDVHSDALRAAIHLADPRLHAALVSVVDRLVPADLEDDDDPSFRLLLESAIRRCDPLAGLGAEQIESLILATLQSASSESGHEVDASLEGDYPVTEVVIRRGDRVERSAIWNFDQLAPDDPTSLDQAFTFYRLANIASRFEAPPA
jgi:hypothetical protein